MAAKDFIQAAAVKLRLDLNDFEKDFQRANNTIVRYTKEFERQGKAGGKMYVHSFGDAQVEINKRLNSMVSSLHGVSPKLGAIGDKAALFFSKPIFAMIPAVSMAFQAMLPVIGTIITIIGALIKGISSAAKKQKEFNDNVKLAKQAHDALASSVNGATEASQKQNDMEERKSVALAKARIAFHNLLEPIRNFGQAIKNLADNVIVSFLEKLEWITKAVGVFLTATGAVVPGMALIEFSKRLSEVEDKEIDAAVAAQKLKDVNAELLSSAESYEKELKNIEIAEQRKAKTEKEAANERLSKADDYLQKLIELRNEAVSKLELDEKIAENNSEIKKYEDAIALMVEQRAEYARLAEAQKQADVKNEANAIEEARLAAVEKYEQAVLRVNNAMAAGLVDEAERLKQIESARAQQYADLDGIAIQYRNVTGEAAEELEITKKLRDETAELVKANQDNVRIAEDRERAAAMAAEEEEKAAANKQKITDLLIAQGDTLAEQAIARQQAIAASAKNEEERTAALDEAIRLENELILKQRQREFEALEQSEAYIAASEEEKIEMTNNFYEITEGMLKIKEEAEEEFGDNWFANLLGIDEKQFGDIMQIGDAAMSAFDSISSAALDISRKHAEEQMAIIERTLNTTLESIQKAREAELIAAGFAVENNIESLEAQLEAAKRTGDEVLIYLTERRLEEQRINDKFDEEARAAEEQAAKEKAEIEFKLAQQEHAMKIISAINAGAMAVINALATPGVPWPIAAAFGIAAGAATGAQIAALISNPPKMPKFANSGIVPGSKYFGDRIIAGVDSGELILNRAHQENIAGQLTAGGGSVTATIVIMLDGRDIAQNTVNLVNDGMYTIKARAIQ
jgi:hypothetical protein